MKHLEKRKLKRRKNENDNKKRIKRVSIDSSKKIICTSAIAIFIVLLSSFLIYKVINQKETFEVSPEIARAREYTEVEDGDENIEGTEYVKFDTFFLKDLDGDGYADEIRGTCNEIGKEDILYMNLSVLNNGILKDGKIKINASNFYFNTAIVKDDIIANNYISTNTTEIVLKDIQNGSQKIIQGTVRSGNYSNSYAKNQAIGTNINNYSRINSITITGTHVADDGTETPINKTVEFTVDWYGDAKASITDTRPIYEYSDMNSLISGDTINLSFSVRTAETENELILKSSILEGTIPELNGYKPTEVTITGTGVTYEYDAETGNFIARKDATVNDNGVITNSVNTSSSGYSRYNSYTINMKYPKQAFEEGEQDYIQLQVPVKTHYEGYNNPNDEFQNPYISNTASTTVIATWRKRVEVEYVYSPKIEITVGRYVTSPTYRYVISKDKPLKIYNGISEEEIEDYYTVRWYAYTGTNGTFDSLILKESKDKQENTVDTFIKTDSSSDSMEDITSNRGIYFSNPSNLLGTEGWIRVYNDDTDELIATFTQNNWNEYSSSNPYMYEKSIKHVRIETSNTNALSSMNVYHIKELDDLEIVDKYYLEQFNELQYIRSNLAVNFGKESTPTTTTASARYEALMSVAGINLSKTSFSTQETCENQIITISTSASRFNQQKWIDGSFLVKIPAEIIGMEINNIEISEPSVRMLGYDLYEEGGNYFIKILTENEVETTYNIKIDCNMTPDPTTKIVSTPGSTGLQQLNKSVELYATNRQAASYYYPADDIYDVNGDLNVTEKVHHSTAGVTLLSPNSLLTSQQATNFDEKGSIIIAPKVAKTDKTQRKATVNVSLTNNYSAEISDVLIQGVIPFEGNKFVIGNRELGSTFTTYMSPEGIKIPDELKGKVTIYYSTEAEPTKDLKNEDNHWITADQVEDWKQVKTYIISLNDYVMQRGESHEFSYEIEIPDGVEYNEISYSEHAIYFAMHTPSGKYSTSTAVSKLGFMIAKQYDLEIVKYQQNTSKPLPGITFSITEEGSDLSSIRTTDANGTIKLTGLYAEKKYTIKELKTTNDYVKIDENIEFYAYADEAGLLHVVYKNEDGTYQNLKDKYSCIRESVVTKNEGEDYKVQLQIDNEVKAKLKLTKKNGDILLKNVKFKLTGQGKNVTLTTNSEGIITTSGLFLNQEYTLVETRADGYYLIEDEIKFKITSTSNGFNLEVVGDEAKNYFVITDNEIPTINLEIDDEKIPTYSLELTKYAKDEEQKLAGAQFRIVGEGLPTNGLTLTTNEEGILHLDGLYEVVKNEDGTVKGNVTGIYTIHEIYAPEGYALDSSDIVFRCSRVNGKLEVEFLDNSEEKIRKVKLENGETATADISIENADTDMPILKFSVENPPIFNLIKVDGDAEGEPLLKDAQFEIYSLDNNRNVIDYAKDINGEYVGTLEGELPITISFIPEVPTSSTSHASYLWSQLDDGTWQSGGSNKGANNLVTTMTSNEFTLIQPKTLSFEWAVSSESASYDYIYYTIKNTKTGESIGGTSTKIGGDSTITSYDKLNWISKDIELQEGTYTISFTYRKDSSADKGLDAGFVKNVRIGNSGRYLITTNEFKEVSLNLPEGLYKLVEVNAPEGYQLSDKEYFFGIGSSKPAESEFKVEWINTVKGQNWNEVNSSMATFDGGLIAVGSFYGEVDLNGYKMTSNGEKDAFIAKYNSNGELEWAKNIGGSKDDVFNKVIQTADGKYAAVGYISSSDINIDSNIKTNGIQDGILIRLDESGNYINSKTIGGRLDDYIYSLTEDSSGNLIIAGGFYSDTLSISETESIQNLGSMDGFVLSLDSSNNCNWYQRIGGTYDVRAVDVTETSEGYVVAANYIGTANLDINGTVTSTGKSSATASYPQDALIIGYSNSGEYIWHKSIGSTNNDKLSGIATLKDGNVLIYGSYAGNIDIDGDGTNDLTTKGQFDNMILKYSPDGEYLEKYSFGSTSNDEVSQVIETEDNGFLLSGWYYGAIDIDGDGTNDLTTSTAPEAFIIKLNEDYGLVFCDSIKGGSYEEAKTVAELNDGGYVVGGTTSSTNTTVYNKANSIVSSGYSDGFLIKYNNVVTAEEIPSSQDITIKNYLKQFKVTSQIVVPVPEENGISIGGTVTGTYGNHNKVDYPIENHIQWVEDGVKYGHNSTKQIVITPAENYVVTSIKVQHLDEDGNVTQTENYVYTADENGIVTMPVFENVKSDIHVLVEFSNTVSSVLVNHLLWTEESGLTETALAESEYYTGQIRNEGDPATKENSYNTYPNIDLAEYEIITNLDYYSKLPNLEELFTEHGVESVHELLVKLDIDETDYYIPDNATGYYAEEQQIVNYYYKLKTYKLTVEHLIEGTEERVPSIEGGTVQDEISDGYKKDTPYDTNNSDKIDYTKYELVEVPENKSGVIVEDTLVRYYYRLKDSAGVIVHHYIDGTETKVPSKDGGVVEDEYLPETGIAKIGDEYITNPSDKIAENYKIVESKIPVNKEGEYEQEVIHVYYYYTLETPGTTNIISKTGTNRIVKEDEEVTYKIDYNVQIEKYIGEATITIVDTLPYPIDVTKSDLDGGTYNYDETTKIATITWTDYITNIDTYNGTNLSNNEKVTLRSDTSLNLVSISDIKNITVVYLYIDSSKPSMTNTVTGKTLLITTNTSTSEVTADSTTTYGFNSNIAVRKVWEDENNKLGIRPEEIQVTLNAKVIDSTGNEVEYNIPDTLNMTVIDENVNPIETTVNIEKTVTLKGTKGETNGENWTYSWPNLEKYDNQGRLIHYYLEEEPLEGNLGVVYSSSQSIDSENENLHIITNTYTKPEEKIDFLVDKVWDDNENKYGKRPEKVRFVIKKYIEGSTEPIETLSYYDLNTNSETEHTFELDRYDSKGNEISYVVVEQEVNTGDLKFYNYPQGVKYDNKTTTIENDKVIKTTTITNTFKSPDDKLEIEVNKVWNDNENSYGKRPNSINLEVYHFEIDENGENKEVIDQTETLEISDDTKQVIEINANDNTIIQEEPQEAVNDNLNEEFVDEILEDDIEDSENTDDINDDTDTNLDESNEILDDVVVNEANKNEVKQVSNELNEHTKKEEITTPVVRTAQETYKKVFTDLRKYDENGNEIIYLVREKEGSEFYAPTVSDMVETEKGYSVVITNTFTVPDDRISVIAEKVWDDENNKNLKRPESIKLILVKGEETVGTAIVTESDAWKTTFENLPKYDETGNEISYSLKEEAVVENDLKFYTVVNANVPVTKTGERYFASITNKFTVPEEKITLRATKVWDDNNKDRLSQITLVLTGDDGNVYKKTISSANSDKSNSNNWITDFEVLKYNLSTGEEVTYTLSEEEVNSGELNRYITSVNGYTVTNTLIIKELDVTKAGPETISSIDEKVEYKLDYKADIDTKYRDDTNITVVDTLPYKIDETKEYSLDGGTYNVDEETEIPTITWTGTYNFDTNTITWSDGSTQVLEINTEDVKINVIEFSKMISLVYEGIEITDEGTTIHNEVKGTIELSNGAKDEDTDFVDTVTDFTKDITVIKDWQGDIVTKEDGTTEIVGRPEEVTVKLNKVLSDGTKVELAKMTLNAASNWKYTWENLARYDKETREEINYNVEEETIFENYYSRTLEENGTFTITNFKYGSLTITKVDNKDKDKKLEGATFKLERIIEEKVEGKDEVEKVVDNTFTPIEKTTTEEGIVIFDKLEWGEYRLTEIEAPEGYNLLKNSIDDIVIRLNRVDLEKTISNSEGLKLPITGGIGITVFTVIGAFIAFISVKLIRANKVTTGKRTYKKPTRRVKKKKF